MKAINDWDKVQASGTYETLPAGGYVCEIKAASEKPNKNNGGSHLEILFDIVEGDYAGWFKRDWDGQMREDKFWRGIINQNIPDENSPKYEAQKSFFKRFTQNIEDSNSGYHWAWDEKTLKGKKCGIVFGEREKESKTGNIYTVTDANALVTVEAIRDGKFTVPPIKKLQKVSGGAADWTSFADAAEDESDLPF